MVISIDTTPLFDANKNRGIGKYTKKIIEELERASFFNDLENNKKCLEIKQFQRLQPIPPCDLVHYPYFDPFFLTLPLFKKYPTVVTIHDLIPLVFPDKFPRGLKGEIKWQIQKQSLKSVKAILTDSECSKKDIIKYTGISKDKIHVVYLAPLLTDIKISENEIINFKNKYRLPDKFLLYVGDINYNKNIPNLFKAVKLLGDKLKDKAIPLVLVGNAFLNDSLYEKKQLDLLAKDLNIKNHLIKLGNLTDKEIKILYFLATIYIQPSLYEGFGLPVVEALSIGCPVICSDRGSLPEVGGEAVSYINPYDPQNIADKINKIIHLDTSSRQDIIEKGKAQAAKFSWNNTVEKTIMIYKNIFSN